MVGIREGALEMLGILTGAPKIIGAVEPSRGSKMVGILAGAVEMIGISAGAVKLLGILAGTLEML